MCRPQQLDESSEMELPIAIATALPPGAFAKGRIGVPECDLAESAYSADRRASQKKEAHSFETPTEKLEAIAISEPGPLPMSHSLGVSCKVKLRT